MRRSKSGRLWVSSVLLGFVLLTGPAQSNPSPIAEVLCAPTAKMYDKLKFHLRAHLAWQGLRSPDQIMELWEDGRGDWTLVIAYSSGKVCIVAMGTEITGFLSDMTQEPPA